MSFADLLTDASQIMAMFRSIIGYFPAAILLLAFASFGLFLIIKVLRLIL